MLGVVIAKYSKVLNNYSKYDFKAFQNSFRHWSNITTKSYNLFFDRSQLARKERKRKIHFSFFLLMRLIGTAYLRTVHINLNHTSLFIGTIDIHQKDCIEIVERSAGQHTCSSTVYRKNKVKGDICALEAKRNLFPHP